MLGDCAKATDGRLLIYVRDLSGNTGHDAATRVTTNMRFIVIIIGLTLVLAVPLVGPARAQPDRHGQNELRRDVERGDARPLSEILAAVREKFPGEVVKVEVERHDGRWVYELRILDDKGRLFELHVDAKTAAIDRVKEK
jgi:uncharacterized membrane protein YkoI